MCFKLDTIKKSIRISRLVKPYALCMDSRAYDIESPHAVTVIR